MASTAGYGSRSAPCVGAVFRYIGGTLLTFAATPALAVRGGAMNEEYHGTAHNALAPDVALASPQQHLAHASLHSSPVVGTDRPSSVLELGVAEVPTAGKVLPHLTGMPVAAGPASSLLELGVSKDFTDRGTTNKTATGVLEEEPSTARAVKVPPRESSVHRVAVPVIVTISTGFLAALGLIVMKFVNGSYGSCDIRKVKRDELDKRLISATSLTPEQREAILNQFYALSQAAPEGTSAIEGKLVEPAAVPEACIDEAGVSADACKGHEPLKDPGDDENTDISRVTEHAYGAEGTSAGQEPGSPSMSDLAAT